MGCHRTGEELSAATGWPGRAGLGRQQSNRGVALGSCRALWEGSQGFGGQLILTAYFFVCFIQLLQRVQQFLWGENVRGSYQHFPLAVGLGHFVSTAHLIQAHTPKDENNEAGATAVLPGGFILVPMSIAGTHSSGAEGCGRAGRDVRIVLCIQFVFNGVLGRRERD